jgi:hypothetical protein
MRIVRLVALPFAVAALWVALFVRGENESAREDGRRIEGRLAALDAALRSVEASAREGGRRLDDAERCRVDDGQRLAREIAGVAGSSRRSLARIEARLLAVEAARAEQARQLGRLARAEDRLAALERPKPSPPERPRPSPPKPAPAAGPIWEWRRIGAVDCWGFQDGPVFRFTACRPVPSLPNACSR